jgi:UDP-GlcNAc:undecaprenyl-phosphate/decaprenyl-phosphate GlcNAc-1-phosphate transferase
MHFNFFQIVTEPLLAARFGGVFLGFFGVAGIVSALATIFILKYHQGMGIDYPDARRKFHVKPVSRLGGAAIFAALLVGMVLAMQVYGVNWQRWWPIVLCNALVFSVGFFDDLKPLGAKTKLVGQFGAALILYSLGISIDMLSNPFGEGSIQLGWMSLPLTIMWLVAIPNIVNLIDGMDGLATGFGLFISLTLGFVGIYSFQPDVAYACITMAGALGGFLIFNFPPAKIFLGDGGAYLIGFFIASVSLLSSNKGSIIAGLLVMLIALGVPILDTLFAIIRRAVRGVPIFKADAEHIHHRLILIGYSKGQALMAMYAACVVLSLVGISILLTKGFVMPLAGAVLFLLAMFAARYLGYVRSWKGLRGQIRDVFERRKGMEYINAHARLLELEVEMCESVEEFMDLLFTSMRRIDLHSESSMGRRELELTLPSGPTITLFSDQLYHHHVDGSFRIDTLAPALNRAWERWNDLPGLVVATPQKETLKHPVELKQD